MRDGARRWKEKTVSEVESQVMDEVEATSDDPEAAAAEEKTRAEQRQGVIRGVKEELKQTARQTSSAVIDISDTGLQQAAAGLDEAIARIRLQAERVTLAGQQAANALRQASGSLQRLRGSAQLKDSAGFMRQSPSVILTAGVIAGFIAGSILQTGSLKESMAVLTGRDSEE